MFHNNLLMRRLHCFNWVQPCRLKGTDLTVVIQQWHFKIIPNGVVAVISFCLMDISTGIASLTGDPTMCLQLMSSLSLFMRHLSCLEGRGNFFFSFVIGAHADSIYFSSTAAFSGVRFFFPPVLGWWNLLDLINWKLLYLQYFKIFIKQLEVQDIL